jgi:hypothetical protein
VVLQSGCNVAGRFSRLDIFLLMFCEIVVDCYGGVQMLVDCCVLLVLGCDGVGHCNGGLL